MIKSFYQLLIELTNRKSLSLILSKVSKSKWSKVLIPSFAKVYDINLAEMEKAIDQYHSLHDFFTRKLTSNARKILQDNNIVVSPVDATIQEWGTISEDYFFSVKGKRYSLFEMFGNNDKVQKYQNGTYILFYLSPRDYHWIHSPVTGKIINQWNLGSKSYPLNKWGMKYGKNPLTKNYRLITEMSFNGNSVAIIKIGAMYINSIELVTKQTHLVKGEEIGYFSFGSSVVLFFEKSSFIPAISHTPCTIKVGECIGYETSDLG